MYFVVDGVLSLGQSKYMTNEQSGRKISVAESHGKNVHSRDPRKPAIMAALKAASGCRKVTLVQELMKAGGYSGNCMNGPADACGFWFVSATDVAAQMPRLADLLAAVRS